MKLLTKWPLLLGTVFVVASCGEAPVTPGPTDASLAISDGAHEGNQNFFFLPPMVSNPNPTGTFDASLSPEVEICVWDGTVCGATLAIYNVNAGPGSETVRVNTEDEHYVVNWHTDDILDNFTLGVGEPRPSPLACPRCAGARDRACSPLHLCFCPLFCVHGEAIAPRGAGSL